MKKPMSERGRQRVLRAAEMVKTRDLREAAILGGIVRCCIDTGHFDYHFVAHYVPTAIDHFAAGDTWCRETLRQTSRRLPGKQEVADVLARFKTFYDPDENALAAA